MCENYGLVILNGRTERDLVGNYTFMNHAGSTVIDYCACSCNILCYIDSFEVDSQIKSEHMPIILTLDNMVREHSKINSTKLTRIVWKKNIAEQYQKALCNRIELLNPSMNGNLNIESFQQILINSLYDTAEELNCVVADGRSLIKKNKHGMIGSVKIREENRLNI